MGSKDGAGERAPSETKGGPSETRGRARTCVGCGERVVVTRFDVPASPLIRLILGPGGVVAVDPGDGGFGRGAHVHPRRECIVGAVSRGLARAAKARVHAIYLGGSPEGTSDAEAPLTPASLARGIQQAMDRRIQGLVRSAVRSQSVAVGADAVQGACVRGEAALVLVACDAAAGAELPEVQRAIAGGRAAAWGTKEALGSLAGGARSCGVAVMAIQSEPIATALSAAVRIADACAAAERGEDLEPDLRPGGRGRRRSQRASARNEGRSPTGQGAGAAVDPSVEQRARGAGPGPRQRPEDEEIEVAAVASERLAEADGGREGRLKRRSEGGRLLAPAQETTERGAATGTRAASRFPGRAPAAVSVAAERRPRGWVRRIG